MREQVLTAQAQPLPAMETSVTPDGGFSVTVIAPLLASTPLPGAPTTIKTLTV